MAKTKAPQVTEESSALDAYEGQGYEGANSKLPMLKIVHLTAEEVTDGTAKAGDFINTATKTVYAKHIDLIVLKAQRAWTVWAPESAGGGFKGKYPVGSFPISGDFYNRANPAVTGAGDEVREVLELYCLDPDHLDEGPFLFSLKGDSIKHGDNLVGKIRVTKRPNGAVPPIWGSVWRLTTQLNKKLIGGKPTSWYTFGEGKSTAVEFQRWIVNAEVPQVKENYDFVISTTKLVAPMQTQERAQIAGPEDAPF
jgi:hypothetical protein